MAEHHNPNESTTVNNLDARGNVDVGGSLTLGSMSNLAVQVETKAEGGADESNAVALSTYTLYSTVSSDASKTDYSLADGTVTNQLKIICVAAADNASVPKIHLENGESDDTLTMDAAGDVTHLQWNGTKWIKIGGPGTMA